MGGWGDVGVGGGEVGGGDDGRREGDRDEGEGREADSYGEGGLAHREGASRENCERFAGEEGGVLGLLVVRRACLGRDIPDGSSADVAS